MTTTMMNLDLAARDVLDEAVRALEEQGYLARLEETYRKAAEPVAKDLGLTPRAWTDEDRRRIRFEALMYLSVLLLDVELPLHLTRRKLLLGREPDSERIGLFRTAYENYLPEKMGSLGIDTMEVPAMGRLPAHTISALDRLREYERLRKTGRAQESFVGFLGHAIDPRIEIVTNIVALESIGVIVKVIREALERQFGPPPRS